VSKPYPGTFSSQYWSRNSAVEPYALFPDIRYNRWPTPVPVTKYTYFLHYCTYNYCFPHCQHLLCFLQDALIDHSVRGRSWLQIWEEVKPGRGQGSDPLETPPFGVGGKTERITTVMLRRIALLTLQVNDKGMKQYRQQWGQKTSADGQWTAEQKWM